MSENFEPIRLKMIVGKAGNLSFSLESTCLNSNMN